jgi:NADH-quinone oxidoreductase subunit G
MCDDGRLSYKGLNVDRVLKASTGRGARQAVARATAVEQAAKALRPMAEKGAVAALFSPAASLEDLLAAAVVAKEALKLGEIYAGGRPDGWQDDFLKRADENPNRKGLELVAQAFGLALRPFADLVRAVESGAVEGVWAVGTEIPDARAAAAFGRLPAFVCQAVSSGGLAAEATALLPASPHSESDGTFVNFEGRAQRFELAYPPRGDSRPHWALCAELGRALGLTRRWQSAREVFGDLGKRLGAALGDFAWDGLPSMPRRHGLIPIAAGTVDGRLPGYRERVDLAEDALGAPAKTSQGGRP